MVLPCSLLHRLNNEIANDRANSENESGTPSRLNRHADSKAYSQLRFSPQQKSDWARVARILIASQLYCKQNLCYNLGHDLSKRAPRSDQVPAGTLLIVATDFCAPFSSAPAGTRNSWKVPSEGWVTP